MLVRKLRLQKGWSQDQLAALSGLSVRTIQRIERGQNPSLESCRAFAAVFEVDISTFYPEDGMNTTMNTESRENGDSSGGRNPVLTEEERYALDYAKSVKDFYHGVFAYVILALVFFSLKGFGEPVLWWVFGSVGLVLIIQALVVFEVISFDMPNWERKIAEKKLGRKL